MHAGILSNPLDTKQVENQKTKKEKEPEVVWTSGLHMFDGSDEGERTAALTCGIRSHYNAN